MDKIRVLIADDQTLMRDWTFKCEQCMRCVGYCPQKAVDSNSFILAAIILIFFVAHVDVTVMNLLSFIPFFIR